MAQAKTEELPKSAPTPPKAKSPAEVEASAKKQVKDVKGGPGFHPLRAFRYLNSFVDGTIKGTFDGMAKGLRKGSWAGIGIGILSVITGAAPAALAMVAAAWVAGMAVGAVGGGALGLVTGGAKKVGLEKRKVDYADDLALRAEAKKAPAKPKVDYRNDWQARRQEQKQNYFVDRIFQQNNEIAQQVREESPTFFQEMVHHSRGNGGHGHGF